MINSTKLTTIQQSRSMQSRTLVELQFTPEHGRGQWQQKSVDGGKIYDHVTGEKLFINHSSRFHCLPFTSRSKDCCYQSISIKSKFYVHHIFVPV